MTIIKPVKLTDEQIIGLVPAAAIMNYNSTKKALNALATHFKREGEKDILTIWENSITLSAEEFNTKYPSLADIDVMDVLTKLKKELE